jgi:hypothetical protein
MKKEDQLKLTSSLQSILKKIEELHETIQVINKRTDYDNDDEEMDDDELLCNLIDYLVEAEETIESAICRVEPFHFVENNKQIITFEEKFLENWKHYLNVGWPNIEKCFNTTIRDISNVINDDLTFTKVDYDVDMLKKHVEDNFDKKSCSFNL